jgi:hypothetical protein
VKSTGSFIENLGNKLNRNFFNISEFKIRQIFLVFKQGFQKPYIFIMQMIKLEFSFSLSCLLYFLVWGVLLEFRAPFASLEKLNE